MVFLKPNDNFLPGDNSSEDVFRARISYAPLSQTIDYTRELSDAPTQFGAITVSPNYEFKPVVGPNEQRDAEARSDLLGTYGTFDGAFMDTADENSTFDNVTNLSVTPAGYLGVESVTFTGSHYGWIKYGYDGTDVSLLAIAFNTDLDEPVILGVLPESSQVMTVIGGLLAGGLIGLRKLRQKRATEQVA